jgi:hypothetical protein
MPSARFRKLSGVGIDASGRRSCSPQDLWRRRDRRRARRESDPRAGLRWTVPVFTSLAGYRGTWRWSPGSTSKEWAQPKRDLRPPRADRALSVGTWCESHRRSVMSAIRVRSGAASASSPTGLIPGARESKLSRYYLWWLLVVPFVGFTLAETVFDLGAEGAWKLWKAAHLGALLMAPCIVGAYFGLRSVPKGFRGGWVGLAANLVLAVLAICMPMAESLTGRPSSSFKGVRTRPSARPPSGENLGRCMNRRVGKACPSAWIRSRPRILTASPTVSPR